MPSIGERAVKALVADFFALDKRRALGLAAGLKCRAGYAGDFSKSGYRLLRRHCIRPLPSMGDHFQRGPKSLDLAIE
jgi:hypothetical protein